MNRSTTYVLSFILIFVLLFSIPSLVHYQYNDTKYKSTPIFPSAYFAEGIITILNTTIKQPFQVWYDFDEGVHRQDYYNGMLISLNERKQNEIRAYDFFPIHTTTLKNQSICKFSIPDEESRLDTFLPLLSNHRYCGEEIIRGIKTEKWCNETNMKKETVFVEVKNSLNESHGQKQISVPMMITRESNLYNEKIVFTKFSSSKTNIEFLTEPPIRKELCLSINKFNIYLSILSSYHTKSSIYENYYPRFGLRPEDYKNLPENFDWREYGGVSEVKNQGGEGPCWSFAAIAAVESAYLIRTNGTKKLDLSEQAALDCSWHFGGMAHYGGRVEYVFQWMIHQGGIPTEEEYGPYLAKGAYCHADKVNLTASISGWALLPNADHNSTVVKAALKRYGPLTALLCGTTSSFINYSKSDGIYNDPECKTKLREMDHAVLLVGYGKQNHTEYWIIKNSFGSHWGDQGYAYIAIDSNVCGLMNELSFVII